MKEFQVHVLIGVALAVAVALNGWAIFRGRIFKDDLDIPGLVLEQGALAFTPSLLGTYHFSPNFENLEFNPLVFIDHVDNIITFLQKEGGNVR